MVIITEILFLILFLIFLCSLSYILFKSFIAPLGFYALIWSAVFITAVLFQDQYSFSNTMYYYMVLSWVSFSFGCALVYLICRVKRGIRRKVNLLEIVDTAKLKKIIIFSALLGLGFSVGYFYEMSSLLSGVGIKKEMIRHFVYAESAEISAQIFTRRWYCYNFALALFYLGAIMGAIYIGVSKERKFFYMLCSIIPVISATLFSIAEMSRGRVIEVTMIYFLTILFLRYHGSFLKIFRGEYRLLLFLFAIAILVAVNITEARGIKLKENMVTNFFANVAAYFLVSIVAFDVSLNYTENLGLRAIFYPFFYILEKISLISVGRYPDPTKLITYATYPTPTYLFWLSSGYGLLSVLTIPFLVGLFSSFFYIRFWRTGNIKHFLFFICSCNLISISHMTWRLNDLWFWIFSVSLVPICNWLTKKDKTWGRK